MAERIDGIALGMIGVGALVAYAGVKGISIPSAAQSIIQGKSPAGATKANPILGTTESASQQAANAATISNATGINTTPPNASTVAGYKAYAQLQLAAHGWPGQFSALNSIVIAESSWNPNAENPSGAYGIAQALGHGTAATQGTVTNEYGNYGTSDSICKKANSGSGTAQIEWMLNYIGQSYGSPDNAWQFHLANGYY